MIVAWNCETDVLPAYDRADLESPARKTRKHFSRCHGFTLMCNNCALLGGTNLNCLPFESVIGTQMATLSP